MSRCNAGMHKKQVRNQWQQMQTQPCTHKGEPRLRGIKPDNHCVGFRSQHVGRERLYGWPLADVVTLAVLSSTGTNECESVGRFRTDPSSGI